MRPPVLPSGNLVAFLYARGFPRAASMRPPVLPSGNLRGADGDGRECLGFNEAAGFTQRKHDGSFSSDRALFPALQ